MEFSLGALLRFQLLSCCTFLARDDRSGKDSWTPNICRRWGFACFVISVQKQSPIVYETFYQPPSRAQEPKFFCYCMLWLDYYFRSRHSRVISCSEEKKDWRTWMSTHVGIFVDRRIPHQFEVWALEELRKSINKCINIYTNIRIYIPVERLARCGTILSNRKLTGAHLKSLILIDMIFTTYKPKKQTTFPETIPPIL